MKNKTQFITIMILILLFAGISSLSFSQKSDPAPIPPNIRIDTPDASLPDEVKLLVGKWTGRWNAFHGWDCKFYVEKVDKNSAQVVHSWGDYTTHNMSCHCSPNWARVQQAKVTYLDGKATIDFITPGYETGHFRKKHHVLSGEDEGWTSNNPKSHGHYNFSFTVEKSEPDVMKGRFISGKGSPLGIVMKKME